MNIFDLIARLATLLSFVIIARIILPMVFPPGRGGASMARLMDILYRITEPILGPIRKVVYRGGPFDFSPMVAILFLTLIAAVLRSAS
ncbi:MAG: YggT family protein [Chloroflexi bacterium]|nr:YggT family protein [Chloroflexota bacterium]